MSDIKNIQGYGLWQIAQDMDAMLREPGALQKHLNRVGPEWSVIHELALMKQCWEEHGASNRKGKDALAVVDACLIVMLALHEIERQESGGNEQNMPDSVHDLERTRKAGSHGL